MEGMPSTLGYGLMNTSQGDTIYLRLVTMPGLNCGSFSEPSALTGAVAQLIHENCSWCHPPRPILRSTCTGLDFTIQHETWRTGWYFGPSSKDGLNLERFTSTEAFFAIAVLMPARQQMLKILHDICCEGIESSWWRVVFLLLPSELCDAL